MGRADDEISVLAPMQTPPVSGWYVVDTVGDYARKPIYLPSPDRILHECEIIRDLVESHEQLAGSLIGQMDGEQTGLREYWSSDIYGRRVSSPDPVDVFDNEYWNQF